MELQLICLQSHTSFNWYLCNSPKTLESYHSCLLQQKLTIIIIIIIILLGLVGLIFINSFMVKKKTLFSFVYSNQLLVLLHYLKSRHEKILAYIFFKKIGLQKKLARKALTLNYLEKQTDILVCIRLRDVLCLNIG